jgi:hypothetical protein
MEAESGSTGDMVKWRLLGFETENVVEEFNDVGMLGLDCLASLPLFGVLNVRSLTVLLESPGPR